MGRIGCRVRNWRARRWPALRGDRRAVTAIEYAIIAGVMVTALVLSVPAIAPEISTIFNNVSQHL